MRQRRKPTGAVSRSVVLFREAQRLMPGGVNSPVRAFGAVGGTPVFMNRGQGARIHSVDRRTFIDYVLSWGPLILGHAHRKVVTAVTAAAKQGLTFGAPTEAEVALARLITKAIPSISMVRMVNSGTEAVMSAIRLARGATGRPIIIKFEGGYHGHADSLLVKAGSGATTLGIPDSAGIPAALAELTVTLPYNDLKPIARTLASQGREIAAIIVEPVAGNMGVVPPEPGFLHGLRALTREHGALLIFDEVITGFRLAYGGAQRFYGVVPDLTCLGKIIGGGLPVGAYGGRRTLMEQIAPLGPVYQAGTLSGNPLAMAAGLATLRALQGRGLYHGLERRARRLAEGLAQAANEAGVRVSINRVGSMLTIFFTRGRVTDYTTARLADTSAYARFFHAMLARGVFLPPSQFEAMFLSTAHTDADIAHTVRMAREAFQEVRRHEKTDQHG